MPPPSSHQHAYRGIHHLLLVLPIHTVPHALDGLFPSRLARDKVPNRSLDEDHLGAVRVHDVMPRLLWDAVAELAQDLSRGERVGGG